LTIEVTARGYRLVVGSRGMRIYYRGTRRDNDELTVKCCLVAIAENLYRREQMGQPTIPGLEPERMAEDGTKRKLHYGDGKQPWDYWYENGWAPIAAASNAHKYVARHLAKNGEDDLRKGRWYYTRLQEMSQDFEYPHRIVALAALGQLQALLTIEQIRLLEKENTP
jgi:hypothetical protein